MDLAPADVAHLRELDGRAVPWTESSGRGWHHFLYDADVEVFQGGTDSTGHAVCRWSGSGELCGCGSIHAREIGEHPAAGRLGERGAE